MCMLTVDNDAWTGIRLGLRLVHMAKYLLGCETLRCIAVRYGQVCRTAAFSDSASWQLSCCLALFAVVLLFVAVVVVNCAAIKGRRRHIKILKCFFVPPLHTINGRGSVAATDMKMSARISLLFLFSGQLQSYPKAITMPTIMLPV